LFHAKVLERFRLIAAPAVGTMGVTASRSGVTLLYSPDFVLPLNADQLGGVLLHEVHHVLLGHLTINPADYSDEWALTVALEVSVNEFVREPLPEGGITLADFPMLPEMESSEQRYHRLKTLTRRLPIASPSTGNVAGGGRGQGQVLDNHSVWQDALKDAEGVRRALAELLQHAAVEAGGIPRQILEALRAVGTMPGNGVHVMRGLSPGTLDWKRLLRRYAGQVLQIRPVFHRPPRRFPELVGILPGHRRLGKDATVVAIIDTSGSISDHCLDEIDGELYRLSRSHPVHVVECDCEIHRVFRYRKRLEHVQGRGGTDFRPALEREFLRGLRPNLVIYFTDGFGPAPEEQPPYPLIWCLVPHGEPPAHWGRVIFMDPHQTQEF
jgi:predicted metal-dependent peptidase